MSCIQIDEILTNKDAGANLVSGTRGADVAGQQESQRPIDRVFYADAGCHCCLGNGETIVAQLEGGAGVKKVCAVVRGPGEAERQAEAAGAGGELANVGVGRKAAVFRHLQDTEIANRLKRTDENASGMAFRFAGYVHAEILAVYGIHISVPGWAE
jgi:hypothetical protein